MGNGFDNTNTNQQQQILPQGLNANDVYSPPPGRTSQPWRPNYGEIAPIYGNTGDGTIGNPTQAGQGQGQTYEGGVPVAPRPVQQAPYQPAPYNQTPGADQGYNPGGGQPYNPGGGAAYNPGGGAAYNPGDQQRPPTVPPVGDNGQSGPIFNQENPRRQASELNDTNYNSEPVVKPIVVFSATVLGGVGGVLGGNVIPNFGNKAAEAILRERPPIAEGVPTQPSTFEKIFGKDAMGRVSRGAGDLGSRFETLDAAGRMERGAVAWQNQFDPRYQQRPALQNMLTETNTKLSGLTGELTEAQRATQTALQQKQAFLSAGESATAKLNPSLFTAEGKTLLEGAKTSTAAFTEAEMSVLNRQAAGLKSAFPEIAAKEMALLERPMVGNFAKGAAFVGGTMLADHLAGNFIGKDGAGHLSHVALPMAFVAGGSWKEKAIYSAAAIGVSKTVDALLPAQDHTTINRIMAPNGVDSLTMGAAFLLPAGDTKTRMAMIGTAWGFGRLRNMNDVEAGVTTAGMAGATGLAMKLGKINPKLGAGLLVAEGGAFLLSRVFRGNKS